VKLSCSVVCLSGLEFGFEFAEVDRAASGGDNGTPDVSFFVEGDAFEAGGFGFFELASVVAIFGVCGEAKIRFSIVERIVIVVVNEEAGRGVEDFAIHPDGTAGTEFADRGSSAGVEIAVLSDDVPFEFAEPGVIMGVNNGEFAFCEGD